MYGYFPEKPRLCLIEQVYQGVKCKSALSNPDDWTLRYIKTYLYFTLCNNDDKLLLFYLLKSCPFIIPHTSVLFYKHLSQ